MYAMLMIIYNLMYYVIIIYTPYMVCIQTLNRNHCLFYKCHQYLAYIEDLYNRTKLYIVIAYTEASRLLKLK